MGRCEGDGRGEDRVQDSTRDGGGCEGRVDIEARPRGM